MSEIQDTQRKLREMGYFLRQLHNEAERTAGDFEQFLFNLSAFLAAGRSVTWVLQVEDRTLYDKLFPRWTDSLPPEDRELLNFMNEKRVRELHKRGAKPKRGEEAIAVQSLYVDRFGRWEVFAPPPAIVGTSAPSAAILRPVWYFDVSGMQRKVTDVCNRYYELLRGLVQEC